MNVCSIRSRKDTLVRQAAVLIGLVSVAFLIESCGKPVEAYEPVPLIFDTDMGNDVDDALALGMLHALQSRGECELLAVTVTKDEPSAAPFVDAINTFYGRPDIPIGVVTDGPTPGPSRFTPLANEWDDWQLRYPHDLKPGDAPGAIGLLRQRLAERADQSVAVVQVGFSTNFARLLESPPDEISPLNGRDLVAQKVRLLSIMAGAFAPVRGNNRYLEYNVTNDVDSARKLVANWPTPIVFSGFEVGLAAPYPAESIENDFKYVDHHPLAEAYQLYQPTPHERPTWDLTSVLYAVRPHRGYFEVSEPGWVTVEEDGFTRFEAAADGLHRYLVLGQDQIDRVTEAMVQLASQPPQL